LHLLVGSATVASYPSCGHKARRCSKQLSSTQNYLGWH
jgi:hypothetical protein